MFELNTILGTPRDTIIMAVLESAKDAEVDYVVEACRRLMSASRRGWTKRAMQADIDLVWDVYENVVREARRS